MVSDASYCIYCLKSAHAGAQKCTFNYHLRLKMKKIVQKCLFSTFIIKKVNDGTRKTMNVIFQWNGGLFERLNGLYKLYFVHE